MALCKRRRSEKSEKPGRVGLRTLRTIAGHVVRGDANVVRGIRVKAVNDKSFGPPRHAPLEADTRLDLVFKSFCCQC